MYIICWNPRKGFEMNGSSFAFANTFAIGYAAAIVAGWEVPRDLSAFISRRRAWEPFLAALTEQVALQSDGRYVVRPASYDLFKHRPMGAASYLAVIDTTVCTPSELITELGPGRRLLCIGTYSNNLAFPAEEASAEQISTSRAAQQEHKRKNAEQAALGERLNTLLVDIGDEVREMVQAFINGLPPEQRAYLLGGALSEKRKVLEALGFDLKG